MSLGEEPLTPTPLPVGEGLCSYERKGSALSNTPSDDLPSIAGVLAPVVAGFPRQQQKLLIAWAERQAAARYRFWAEQVGTQERAGFLRCAAREEDIAARIEALDPDAAAIRQQLLAELPDLEAQVLAVYADRSLEEQWEIQRRGERAGKKTWEAFAAAEDDTQVKAMLLACAALEDENASFLRGVLAKRGGR